MYDTIIIGKGPSGISAAVYLKRAGLNVLVIGKDRGTLEKAGHIENYYGITVPISGKALFNRGIKQAQRLDIEIITDEVTSIEYFDGLTVKTSSALYKAKSLLFAIGKKKKTVNIKGVKEFSGNGISWCAVCDGFFYKNKNAAVIGNGALALSEAEYLRKITDKVTIFTDGGDIKHPAASDFNIITDKITEIFGTVKVEGIRTEKAEYSVDGIFIAKGSAGAEEFALKMGLETKDGNIVVDKDFQTNIPGVYAAGDCIGGFLQVAKAVSDGANAANSIIKFVKNR